MEPQANDFNKREAFNVQLFRRLGTTAAPDGLGLLGLTVQEEFGGTAMDATAVAIVHEELSYSDPAFCLSYLAHSLLFVNNLHVNGSKEQKERFLPDACAGNKIAGMAMSEPQAGTDVLGMTTKAKQNEQGWKLNGRKMWITVRTKHETVVLVSLPCIPKRHALTSCRP